MKFVNIQETVVNLAHITTIELVLGEGANPSPYYNIRLSGGEVLTCDETTGRHLLRTLQASDSYNGTTATTSA